MSRVAFWRLLVLALIFVGQVSYSHAAIIFWNASQQISGDSDVSTLGLTNRAYLFAGASGPSATVNGVTFSEFTDQATDTSTFGGSGNDVFGSPNAPYSATSTEYKSILANAFFNPTPGTAASITLNNLALGDTYLIQVWVNDSRGLNRSETVSGSPTLAFNTTLSDGGLGQFVIGTFVADAASQLLTFTPNDSLSVAQLNGLQLRNVTTSAVPEPTTLTMFAFGAIALVAFRSRRRRT